MSLFKSIRVEIQVDTAYVVHSEIPANPHNLTLDSILSQHSVDTLYGNDAHLIYVQPAGSVSFIWVVAAIVIIAILAVLFIMALRTLKRQEQRGQAMMQEMQHLVQSNRRTCEAIAVL